MVWRTHVAFGYLFVLLFSVLAFGHPFTWPIVLLTFIGSLAPDLDADDAKIKHLKIPWGHRKSQSLPLFPLILLSELLHPLFGHRGFWHSLWATFLVWLIGLAICLFGHFSLLYAYVFTLAYFSHLLADSLTPSGVPFLYPLNTKYHLLPRALSIRTGSLGDTILFGLASAIVIIALYTQPQLLLS